MRWRAQVQLSLDSFELHVDLSGDDTPVALVGPNGSGKTTLLRAIAGAHPSSTGHVRIGDHVLFDSDAGVDLPPEARRVGYVPQGYALFPHLSVVDNVAFGLVGQKTPGRNRQERRKAARTLLQRMECGHLEERQPMSLSGGEQQRVALARALMIEPSILLLDEPLAALDVTARRSLRQYLAEHLAERAGPAIVVTHDIRDVRALGATVVAIERGRVVQSGDIDEVAAHPVSPFLAEFFAFAGPPETR